MSRWNERSDVQRGDAYDARWVALEAAGRSVHGEADLVEALLGEAEIPSPAVLDAGCGTGRVAAELARRVLAREVLLPSEHQCVLRLGEVVDNQNYAYYFTARLGATAVGDNMRAMEIEIWYITQTYLPMILRNHQPS